MTAAEDPRRVLPSLDQLLSSSGAQACIERWGRAPFTDALRSVLDLARSHLAGDESGPGTAPPEALADLLADPLTAARSLLERRSRPGLRRVLNGTGVVLHTNLGRAQLAREALDALVSVGAGWFWR